MKVIQLSTPPLGSWFTTASLKLALFLGVAGTSSVALVSSTSRGPEKAVEVLNDTLEKVSGPLKPYANKVLDGTKDLFGTLGDWSKLVANQKDKVSDWLKAIKLDGVATGTKVIFDTLSKWGSTAYDLIKKYIPSLWNKEFWEKVRPLIHQYGSKATELLSLLSNVFKSGMGGNESLMGQIFKALGQGNFGDFLSAAGQLASKQGEVFKGMSGQEFGDLMHAYNQNPEGTTKTLQEFSKRPEGTVKTEEVMGALKPSALIGRIKAAIAHAQSFTAKTQLNPSEKREARQAYEELQKLSEMIKQTLSSQGERRDK